MQNILLLVGMGGERSALVGSGVSESGERSERGWGAELARVGSGVNDGSGNELEGFQGISSWRVPPARHGGKKVFDRACSLRGPCTAALGA
jgi:hypothetical protein